MEFQVEATEYVAPAKVNPFKETVAEHIKAYEADSNAARTITVSVADAAKATLLYQKAANEQGKTAKLRVKDESGVKAGKPDADGEPTLTGNVKITFTITQRNKARRGQKPTEEAQA